MLGTRVPFERYRAWLNCDPTARSWLDFDPTNMAHSYNKLPFLVRHELDKHPAFTLEALTTLCRRIPSAAFCRYGVISKDAHFDTSLTQQQLTLEEALADLVGLKAYIAIYNPEQDPEYRAIIEGLLAEIARAVRPYQDVINWYSTYIFISAQDSLTPYHMDREMNFLLQIRGTKLAKLWDPNDDKVMSLAQRDHLFSNAVDARPPYRPDLDRLAMEFNLAPGLGVHHPFIAPHLVHTASDLSISLAITFRSPRSDIWSDAHRFNEQFLRRFGLPAGRIGQFATVDHLKAQVVRATRETRNRLRGAPIEA